MAMIKRCAVALAMLLGVSVAHAAGLGKLTVHSALGQPLNAEIDLVSLQPGELDSLTARVAPPENFRDARIEYSSSVRLLRFAVDKRQNGQPYLKVTSVAPINEPFVDVLIEVTWPAGRLQREYPILLDPPGYAQAKVAPPTVAAAPSRAETPPASAPAVSSPAPAPAAEAKPAEGKAASEGTAAPSAQAEMAAGKPGEGAAGGSDTYGPVQKGDTLHKIAESVKPASVSLEQMLVALYRENKSAFVNNNMNRLKTGQILKVPGGEDVGKIAPKEATTEYRTHVADWKAYREQLASGVAAIPAKPESTNAASGRVASAAVTPPAPPAAPSGDVLKLSKTEGGKAGATKGGGGQERLNALQEEVTAKDKALKEAQSRVADLEKQIRDMQRLMDLKAGAPAKDAKVAVAPPAPTKPAEAPKAEVKPAEAPKPAEAAKPAEAPKAADAAKAPETKPAEAPATAVADASKPAEPAKPAEAPKAAAAKPAAPKKVAPPPPPPSFMDEITDNPLMLAGIGGVVVLGLGGLLYMRRRRAQAEEPTPSQMTSSFPSDLKPSTGAGKPASGLVDTGNSSFLTDFDKTGPGTIDTDEVDPVAEAEVYIAYGRDAQAEEILKEAMARDKNRHEIALKLLEIYHARKSATAFETVAKELRGAVGESSPMWQKAAAMGAQIDPNNPLYGAAAASGATFAAMAPAAPAPKPDLDFDIESVSTGSQPASPSFDLNLDAEKTGHGKGASALDFNLDSSSKSGVDVPAEMSKNEKPAFDFDLSGLDMPATKKPAATDADFGKTAAMDLADLNLAPAAAEGSGEGVGTKLELAKAYLEIGDKDGAREILQEVAKEGSAPQKAEAQKLMATL